MPEPGSAARPRVLIHVQHLLGSGHLQRAVLLARALAGAGCPVRMLSGGPPVRTLAVSGFEFCQLPVLRSPDASFKRLVDADGREPDAEYLAERRRRMLAAATGGTDVLLIEGWPFARRKFRAEIFDLIGAVDRPGRRPLTVSSVRDVLQRHGKPERYAEALDNALRYIDRVLVHGDPRVIELAASFPHADRLQDRLAYTGYVTRPIERPSEPAPRGEEILVSAGGGSVGRHLLEAALGAAARERGRRRPWRLLVSHAFAESDFRSLAEAAPTNCTVERNRADFLGLLAACAVSVSQAGYNTLAEILQTATPAVLVPFASGDETEQLQRARAFVERGRCACVEESRLSPESLLDAVEQAVALPVAADGVDLDGAARSAGYIIDWWREGLPAT